MTTPTEKTVAPDRAIAVDAEDAAALFGVSTRHFRRLVSCERAPRPIQLGAATRWRVDDLRAWAAGGCPDRAEFEESLAAANS